MYDFKTDFSLWMKQTTNLSNSSIYKYVRAVTATSKDMILAGIIEKPLIEMKKSELDAVIPSILQNPMFIVKNKCGNHMYSNGLKQYRSCRMSFDDEISDFQDIVNIINSDSGISVTEKEAIVKSRVGQGIFRESLLDKYNNRCIITGINIKSLLIASHIKPWAVSNNSERLSVENGLLLGAIYDRLFDSELIFLVIQALFLFQGILTITISLSFI